MVNEEKLKELLKLPIAPHATNFKGQLTEVENKIEQVPNELCWRCYQNFDGKCTAFLCSHSDAEYNYRVEDSKTNKQALCLLIRN